MMPCNFLVVSESLPYSNVEIWCLATKLAVPDETLFSPARFVQLRSDHTSDRLSPLIMPYVFLNTIQPSLREVKKRSLGDGALSVIPVSRERHKDNRTSRHSNYDSAK